MALVLDAEAVREEARARGEDLMAALARYQAFGVNGVAFPERLVRDWVGKGSSSTAKGGSSWRWGFPRGPAGTT